MRVRCVIYIMYKITYIKYQETFPCVWELVITIFLIFVFQIEAERMRDAMLRMEELEKKRREQEALRQEQERIRLEEEG